MVGGGGRTKEGRRWRKCGEEVANGGRREEMRGMSEMSDYGEVYIVVGKGKMVFMQAWTLVLKCMRMCHL